MIGLGYVGLPLAVLFSKKYKVIGYDIDISRVEELKNLNDRTNEVDSIKLKNTFLNNFEITSNLDKISDCNIYIITVPTPIDKNKKPNLSFLKDSSKMVGSILKKNDIVIYESTVFPGATEEYCVPLLEEKSGLKLNESFYCGYSPERINPGDKDKRLENIVKVTSGSTPIIANEIDELYQQIIPAGTYKAESIKIAEAAKVIENTQRDLNIALINEFSVVFNKLGIDTESVLNAARTKWNFLPFQPGLVGGHCIGVDPYYLTHKSIEMGYMPEVILAGRRLNDEMGSYIASRVTELMVSKCIDIADSNVLVMGLTFKENCPDFRNTMVVNLIDNLNSFNCNVDVYDPWVNRQQVFNELGITPIISPVKGKYDVIILAVAHEDFKVLGISSIKAFAREKHLIYDVKYLFDRDSTDGRL